MSVRAVIQRVHDAVVEEFGDPYLSRTVGTGIFQGKGDDLEHRTRVDNGLSFEVP